MQTDNGGVRRTGAELSFRTVTRRVLTVTEPKCIRSLSETHGRRGVGIAAGVLRGRARPGRWRSRDRTGGSDQAEQSVGEAERGPSGDEQNNTRRLRAVGASCEFPSGFSVIPGQRHVDPKAWQLMTLEVSADAPANVALRVGSGVAVRADIDVQLLVAEPTGGFGDLGVAASGELGDALDSFATLLLSAGVVAVLGGRRAADARDEQRVSDSELRVPTAATPDSGRGQAVPRAAPTEPAAPAQSGPRPARTPLQAGSSQAARGQRSAKAGKAVVAAADTQAAEEPARPQSCPALSTRAAVAAAAPRTSTPRT